MYLSELFIESFRIFGAEQDGLHLCLSLHPGLNVLVGENDSGRTAVVDALRYALWTTSQEHYRLTEDDFFMSGGERARTLTIQCVFRDLPQGDAARYLHWLSAEQGKPRWPRWTWTRPN